MLKPVVRSLVSTIAAACFAFIASTGGALPVCSGPGSVAEHEQQGTTGHPAGHHGAPAGSQGCVVHLCCAHLHISSPGGLGSERLSALRAAPGFVPSADVPSTRIPHAFPFAQAPPPPLV